jgi:hypothetical protein
MNPLLDIYTAKAEYLQAPAVRRTSRRGPKGRI